MSTEIGKLALLQVYEPGSEAKQAGSVAVLGVMDLNEPEVSLAHVFLTPMEAHQLIDSLQIALGIPSAGRRSS